MNFRLSVAINIPGVKGDGQDFIEGISRRRQEKYFMEKGGFEKGS